MTNTKPLTDAELEELLQFSADFDPGITPPFNEWAVVVDHWPLLIAQLRETQREHARVRDERDLFARALKQFGDAKDPTR